MVIMAELCNFQPLCPVVLPVVDKCPEVLFHLLVNTLRLSICLWVVGCGCIGADPEESEQFSHVLGYKLRVSVMDDLPGKSMIPEHALSQELGKTFCCQGHRSWLQLDHLTEGIHDDKDSIISIRQG